MPTKLDTFAVTVPGLRGYFNLKLWDKDSTQVEDDDEDDDDDA